MTNARSLDKQGERLTRLVAAVVLGVAALATVRAAGTPREIVEEAQRRSDATSQRYIGTLQVFDEKGRIADKQWTFERLGSHGESKSILRFTAPADVKGVALLIVNHRDRSSDQWMWTPAIERDRRIALQDRSTRFFGTDFSFEDLEERDVDHYRYRLLGEEELDGSLCWKIEATPVSTKRSQYTKSIAWIRQDIYAFVRFDSYVGTEVRRRLVYSGFEKIQGIWTGLVMDVTDFSRGSRTRLTLKELEYNRPFREEDFTLQALRRQ